MNQKLLDLEFRIMTEFNRDPEIVRWVFGNTNEEGCCYTLAWWKKDSEGYSLDFIGARPLDPEVDKDAFWELVKYGQKICDAIFAFDDYVKDIQK